MKFISSLFLLFIQMHCFGQGIGEFVSRYGIKSDSVEIQEKGRQFFHSSGSKWWKGEVESHSGDTYNAEAIKFNVFENSVYVKNEGMYYRFPSTNVLSFSLSDGTKSHQFERGFGEPRTVEVKVKFDTTLQAVNSYLLSFPQINDLVLKKINIEGDRMTLEVEAGLAGPIRELRLHILGHLGIKDFEFEFENSEITESMYLEVLHSTDKMKLLKHHFKKSTQNQSISLVKHTSTHMFAQHDFYLARTTGEIKEVILTPSSIKGALEYVGVQDYLKVKGVRTEDGLVAWFRRNFSDSNSKNQ